LFRSLLLQIQEAQIVCVTKNDSGSENLYNLRDIVVGYLTETDPEKPSSLNGFKTKIIPVYEIEGAGESRKDLEIISYINIIKIHQGVEGDTVDQINFMPLRLSLRIEAMI